MRSLVLGLENCRNTTGLAIRTAYIHLALKLVSAPTLVNARNAYDRITEYRHSHHLRTHVIALIGLDATHQTACAVSPHWRFINQLIYVSYSQLY